MRDDCIAGFLTHKRFPIFLDIYGEEALQALSVRNSRQTRNPLSFRLVLGLRQARPTGHHSTIPPTLA